MKKLRKNWWLGFLGFIGFWGIPEIIRRDWSGAIWILWFVWFIHFIPLKKK
jgi:hypothetical protein